MPSVKVVGSYGGKLPSKATTTVQITRECVIDAGNLINGLGDDARFVDAVFITHSHLDHIVDLAFLIDSYFSTRQKTITIYALPETIKVLRENLFNDKLWPDFSKIKLPSGGFALTFVEIAFGKDYIFDTFTIQPVRTNHSVPSCGYIVTIESSSILITADTYISESLLAVINQKQNISSLMIECSFPSAMRELAIISKHMTPELLNEFLSKIERDIKIYVNHMKPAYVDIISKELRKYENLKLSTIVDDGFVVDF